MSNPPRKKTVDAAQEFLEKTAGSNAMDPAPKKAPGPMQQALKGIADVQAETRALRTALGKELQDALRAQYELGRRHVLDAIAAAGCRLVNEEGTDITLEVYDFLQAGDILEQLYKES